MGRLPSACSSVLGPLLSFVFSLPHTMRFECPSIVVPSSAHSDNRFHDLYQRSLPDRVFNSTPGYAWPMVANIPPRLPSMTISLIDRDSTAAGVAYGTGPEDIGSVSYGHSSSSLDSSGNLIMSNPHLCGVSIREPGQVVNTIGPQLAPLRSLGLLGLPTSTSDKMDGAQSRYSSLTPFNSYELNEIPTNTMGLNCGMPLGPTSYTAGVRHNIDRPADAATNSPLEERGRYLTMFPNHTVVSPLHRRRRRQRTVLGPQSCPPPLSDPILTQLPSRMNSTLDPYTRNMVQPVLYGRTKLPWTAREERELINYIGQYGIGKWKLIKDKDAGGEQILARRTHVNLKDKARTIAEMMIR